MRLIEQLQKIHALTLKRLRTLENRVFYLEQKDKANRRLIKQFQQNTAAQIVAAANQIYRHGIMIVVKITEQTGLGTYRATRRALGDSLAHFWQEDSDNAETIVVRTLPLWGGDGEEAKHFGVLPIGAHVLASWIGRDQTGADMFVAVSHPFSWLGIMQSCNKGTSSNTGLCTVRPATGTINNATPVTGAADVVCQIGKEAWGRVGDAGYAIWVGGEPPWLFVADIKGLDTYNFPTNLDPDQTTPQTSSKCNTAITP